MTAFPASESSHPTLALIDAVRGPDNRLFSTDPHATALERRARELTENYWPEQAWLTGSISPALLGAVTRRLEVERDALHQRIQLIVVSEQRSSPRT